MSTQTVVSKRVSSNPASLLTDEQLKEEIETRAERDLDFDGRCEGQRLTDERIVARVKNAHQIAMHCLREFAAGPANSIEGHIVMKLDDFARILADISEAEGIIEGDL